MEFRVLIIDRERVFGDAVAAHLEGEQDIKVVAAIRPGPNGEFAITGRGADVVLLDADLPGGAANSVCEKLTGPRESARVIMLSGSSEPERIVAAIRAGASAWVRKDESFGHLLRVVRGTGRGETWLPPAEAGTVLRMLMSAQDQRQRDDMLLAALTPREREILACFADGAGRRDVAEQLNLSANTVRTHLQNAMSKLGVHSTLEAVALTRWARADNLRCQRASHACPNQDDRGPYPARSCRHCGDYNVGSGHSRSRLRWCQLSGWPGASRLVE
jgi:DNA-binding NarL/FixJ family response regulator